MYQSRFILRTTKKLFVYRKRTTPNHEHHSLAKTWTVHWASKYGSSLCQWRQENNSTWQNKYLSLWIQDRLTWETNKGTDRGDLAKWQGRRQGSNRGASTEPGETGKYPTKLGIKRNGAQTEKCTTSLDWEFQHLLGKIWGIEESRDISGKLHFLR